MIETEKAKDYKQEDVTLTNVFNLRVNTIARYDNERCQIVGIERRLQSVGVTFLVLPRRETKFNVTFGAEQSLFIEKNSGAKV